MKLSMKERLRVLLTGRSEIERAFYAGDDLPSDGAMSPEMAMKYSAVNACVRVRAETFASVPAMLYIKTKDGREPVTDLTLYDVLHYRPNDDMAPFGFKEALMTNFDVSGNALCQKLVNRAGDVVGLVPMKYDTVEIRKGGAGGLEYVVRVDGRDKILTRREIFHVPNLSFDGLIGLSPISYAAQAIALGVAYEKYGVNFYKNAALPSGVFEHPTELSQEAFERLREGVKANYTGLRNSGVPMILEGGMKWSQITINPVDAQLLESKYFQIEDICRIYRVPQHLVNKLDRSTYSNIEHMSLEFVMYTMLPIFKRFEDNINAQLLTPEQRKKGYYVEFKIDGLLRGDAKSRAEAYGMGRQWGWLSVNDIRRLENMPPIPNGDRYLEPMNFREAGSKEDPEATNRAYAEILAILKDGGRA